MNGIESSPPKELSGRRKSRSQPADEASFLPSNDRNEWYYPTARQLDTEEEIDDDEEYMDYSAPSGSNRGNWGKKLSSGARWVRRGKIVGWGPSKSDWDLEDRARKRLRRAMPSSRSRSQSPQTLSHLRSWTPPFTVSYPHPSVHPDLTSFVLEPAVQQAFTSSNLSELQGTSTELIAGEAALRKAFGGLWRALEGDIAKHETVYSHLKEEAYDPDEDEDEDELRNSHHRGPTPLQKLFISSTSIPLPGPEPKTFLSPQSQAESLEWALGVLRELSDDGKEYTHRLEEIRDGLGKASAIRSSVWRECRIEALEEMAESTN